VEDILLPHVVHFLQAHPDMTLQHDNATSHTARSVRDFLQDRNVSVGHSGQRRENVEDGLLPKWEKANVQIQFKGQQGSATLS
jgi:hypothetical protein